MIAPKLAIGDGHLGLSGALTNVFPQTQKQRCWNHRIVNILDKVPKKQQRQAKLVLTEIPYAPTTKEAERLKGVFQAWCDKKGCAAAGQLLDKEWDRMVAFYRFPKEHWKHLRTTNPVESPFATVRLRTTAAKRYKKVENATAVIWFVTPAQRHSGAEENVLAKRKRVYEAARKLHPERWSGSTRCWEPVRTVHLKPDKESALSLFAAPIQAAA